MKTTTGWRITGGLMVGSGLVALFTGRAGLTFYGRTEGTGAIVVGVLMIVCGIGLILPQKPKRND
jgi:hypothetical protein